MPVRDLYRDPVQIPQFRSKFGGLWTDLNNATELIEGKLSLGMINSEEAGLLKSFVENGYVVLPVAVDLDDVDAFNHDVNELAKNPPPEAWVSCSEDGHLVGRQMKRGDTLESNKGLRLLDVYSYLPSARRVVLAPRLIHLIKLMFERPVLTHQSLLFFKGSQQRIHQDTAFVRISSTMELVASWIALEDILPGSGELVYYPKSHEFPEFLFEGKCKWMPPGSDEIGRYHEHLDACAQAMQTTKTKFLAKKGDAFIWSADLAHGGGEVDDPAKTRRSIATHYCPLSAYPMYRDYVGASETVNCGNGVYYCSEKKACWSSA